MTQAPVEPSRERTRELFSLQPRSPQNFATGPDPPRLPPASCAWRSPGIARRAHRKPERWGRGGGKEGERRKKREHEVERPCMRKGSPSRR